MAGFSFVEPLRGTFYMLAEPMRELAIELRVEAHVRSVRAPSATVTGRVHAEGLVDDGPVQGTLDLGQLHDRRIPYELAFVGADGRRMRLRGEKDLSWLAPVETLVVLHFTIGVDDEGTALQGKWTEIARGTMRFDVSARNVRGLVRSLRASPF